MDVSTWNYISIHHRNNLLIHICWCTDHWLIYFQVDCLSQNYIPVSYSAVAERVISLYVFAAGTTRVLLLPGVEWDMYQWECVNLKGVLSTSEVQDTGQCLYLSYLLDFPIAYRSCSVCSSMCLKWDFRLSSAPWDIPRSGADFSRIKYQTGAWW